MKKLFCFLFISFFIVMSCSKKEGFEIGKSSSLLNKNDIVTLKKIFKDNDVSNVDLFFSLLSDYNKEKDKGCGLNDWVNINDLNYDDVACIERYESNHNESDGNCRMTSYMLLSDLINTKKYLNNYNGTYLMFDQDVIYNNKDYKIINDNYDEFITIFSEVDVSKYKKDEIKNVFGEKWKEYGIKIESDKVSLISVILHDDDFNLIFVGHAGILIELENKYVFVEKIAFELPYKVTVVEKLDDLKEILFSREDYISSKDEEGPFIYQNDKLLYSYK